MKLTKKAFIEWLQTKDDHEVVGDANLSEDCPLANYAKETIDGLTHVDVGDFRLRYFKNNRLYSKKMPGWATYFVRTVDEAFYEEHVRVEQAYSVLNGECEAEEAEGSDEVDYENWDQDFYTEWDFYA